MEYGHTAHNSAALLPRPVFTRPSCAGDAAFGGQNIVEHKVCKSRKLCEMLYKTIVYKKYTQNIQI
jgi:hypothetical protein